MMDGASGKSEKDGEEAREDPDSKDIGREQLPPEAVHSGRAPEIVVTVSEFYNSEMEPEETVERREIGTGPEDHPGRDKSGPSTSPARSESPEGTVDSSQKPGLDIAPFERPAEFSSPETTDSLSSSKGSKGHPAILGGIRRESSAGYHLRREALGAVAVDQSGKLLGRSVSMQTDKSWLYDRYKKRHPKEDKLRPENDIYAVWYEDLSCLDILCDTEFQEDFLKLFQESLRTLSSVGPPTILAYRPESSREDINFELEKHYGEICEFCGSPLRNYPSFESLEQIAEYGNLFCCQQCRDLHEFIVNEKKRYVKEGVQLIDITTKQVEGTAEERKKARERARQRLKEKQMAQQAVHLPREKAEREKDVSPTHVFDYTRQLSTISYCLSQYRPSITGWTKMPLQGIKFRSPRSQDASYSISSCDFTIAGGKLLKNQFFQQYYKNGVKFLTMFPDGSAQIFYPSGNLAIIIVRRNEGTGYVAIVQDDKPENAEIQAVFDSCGNGTCYHSNGNVWINVTIRGGHYSDEAGNKVKTWIWPNNLQKCVSRAPFKPVFLSLNQNVGVRIVEQDRVAISFLARGKQAKINIGAKVKPLAEHHPWPKFVSEDDLFLFACRIKILRIFAKLQGCLDFPNNDWWSKLQLPSFLFTKALKLMNLCKECEISSALDTLIMETLNSPA
ncbi:glutamate-rich protein 6 isoform X1 [Podarcis raffonei]|uniref:glutamate-rich protein 6 isoform X1 n=2 Tax=Podarcis raffonei TaxID=65483 RepID=UPI00232906DE|nr:glutamate-rich protein 6 isoform X1 [Podarcis raffonei]